MDADARGQQQLALQARRHFEVRALAARFRVAHLEAQRQGGLGVEVSAAKLRAAIQDSSQLYGKAYWQDWIFRALMLQVDSAVKECQREG